MKICVYGAGAIGGLIGGLLSRAGLDVSLVARGAHLAAIRANGLRVRTPTGDFTCHPKATDNPADLGPQDYVIVSLKATAAPTVVDAMQPLLGPDTAVVTAMNGIPWWYFHGVEGPNAERQLESVDPGGVQWRGIGPQRAIGTVVWQAAELEAPGVVNHSYGDRLPLGEPDGSKSERATALSKAMVGAGLKSPVRTDLRNELWMKLWGNLSFNPVSVLTMQTLAGMARDPETRAVIAAMMSESKAVGEALGIRFAMSVDKRIATAEAVGEHKTSMMQDLELGRPMELDALVGSIIELAGIAGLPVPTIETVYRLALARARQAGCFPA
ncbi:2-dehydropantoate 2-reductase [Oceanibacterium hippocampi]|uniref:2-dehydropantoate 2-reductase n=1 Tax=Oceanibacterium hippocampi TaxID=745714 RepID=A0A1Y5RW89_9PROT|nr:2-dehydropantoate 2-reductase [Oceanibacterium hippocampi]SLN25919.1 2-dehydropantoate 2-reductase [Oceanibacterium hippocampi]